MTFSGQFLFTRDWKNPGRWYSVIVNPGFIMKISMQDKEASLNYWEKYLAGYQQQAGLPRLSTGKKEAGADYRLEEYDFEIGKEETRGLADLASKNQVTLNTVFQALWGLVLQKYNNTDDVVFGAVVSGRPAGLPGVEKMVGLFINTIPVRISIVKNAPAGQHCR
jgi:hypothetical protein